MPSASPPWHALWNGHHYPEVTKNIMRRLDYPTLKKFRTVYESAFPKDTRAHNIIERSLLVDNCLTAATADAMEESQEVATIHLPPYGNVIVDNVSKKKFMTFAS